MNSGGPARSYRKALFLVLFAVLAVAVLWSAVAYFRWFEGQHRMQVERQLMAIADLKSDELASWRKERLGDAAVFSGNRAFTSLVRGFLAGDDAAGDELRSWLVRYQEAFSYDAVMLLDGGYRKRYVVPESPGRPERPVSFVSPASGEELRAGRVVLEDFYRNDSDQRIYLKVLAPVLDESAGNALLAVVALRIDPNEFLYPFLARWPTPSPTAETLLVRREGRDALYLNELKYRKGSALSLRMPLDRSDVPAARAALGERGIVEGIDYRGIPVITAVRPVAGSPWFLVARVDAAEVLAPVRERGWMAAAFAGVILLAGAAILALGLRALSAKRYWERVKAAEALQASQARLHAITEGPRREPRSSLPRPQAARQRVSIRCR